MNATIVTRPTTTPQPKIIPGTPWAWGFEDGARGRSIYLGYHLFCGAKLAQYKAGWVEGNALVTDTYVPFQCPELYADAQPAENRDDWIGE